MRLIITLILNILFCSSAAYANNCETVDGYLYECGNTQSMLLSILENVEITDNTAYIYNGQDDVLRHIIRYSDSFTLSDDSYFQDYILNVSGGFFHLVHFVKQKNNTYDAYLETDILPSGSFNSDTIHVSQNVNYLGTSNDLTFDFDGYPSATVQTATDTRILTSNSFGLSFSIVGEFTESYRLVYRLN